jgi:hypothetical protein
MAAANRAQESVPSRIRLRPASSRCNTARRLVSDTPHSVARRPWCSRRCSAGCNAPCSIPEPHSTSLKCEGECHRRGGAPRTLPSTRADRVYLVRRSSACCTGPLSGST